MTTSKRGSSSKPKSFTWSKQDGKNRRNTVLDKTLGAKRVPFEELIEASDYVSVHVPLMDATRHLFSHDVFKRMKKTAYLINTSRGPVVDEAALMRALKEHEIAGAGIDVFEFEPKMVEGLADLDNVVVTPHTASATVYTRNAMGELAARNVLRMLRGEKPETPVNPEIFE